MELTQVQREILTALINIQRRKGRAVKGDEIAVVVDRNPGTIRNQMQSLKALRLVEGVPGPKGGYRSTAAAYEVLNLSSNDQVIDVPVIKNGLVVEGITANEITFATVMNPDRCTGTVQIIGNIRDFDVGEDIVIGPTPVNRLFIKGIIAGRDDTSNRLIFDVSDLVSVPKMPVRDVARPAITVGPDTSLKEVSAMMINAGVQEALVKSNNELQGLINLESIVKAVSNNEINTSAKDVMITDYPTIDADSPLYKVVRAISSKTGTSQLVVIESGQPWGIIENRDLIQALIFA